MENELKNKLKQPKNYLLFGILIIFLLEVFFCNYRFWESLSFKPITNYQLGIGEGIEHIRDNIYYVNGEGDTGIYIYGMEGYVNNLYLDMDFADDAMADNVISISSVDEGNGGLVLNFQREYNPKVVLSHYYRTHFYGKVSAIQIGLSDFAGQEVTLSEIQLNVRVPFQISGIRIVIMVLIFGMVLLFIYAPILSSITYEKLKKTQMCYLLMIVGIILVVLLFADIAEHNALYTTLRLDADQYMDLTDALLQGKVSLNREVSKELTEMANPYDYFARLNSGVEFLWDYAYFDGQYYVYFGIVPVLLFYIPWYLIFKSHLLARKLVFFVLFLALWGTLTLLWKLMKKYFPKTPLVLFGFINLLIAFAFGSCISHNPDIYSIPILTSIAFSALGLYLGVLGFEVTGKKKILCFVFSALSLALTAGCRPQFVLVVFFLLPAFVEELKKKENSVKEKIKVIVAIAIPYMVVAAGLMYYNYIRFGSVFDFGANYNLTTNDMRYRGFVLDRIWDGIFYQLLQPVALTNTFPFVEQTLAKFTYNGIVIQEFIFGGFFSFCPIVYLGLYSLLKKNYYENKKVKGYLWGSIILGMVILIVDTEMAGIVYRYILDFGLFFLAPAMIAIMEIFNGKRTEESRNSWFRIIILIIIMSLVLYALYPFVEYDFLYNDFFMKVKTAVQFW